jgi:hypothetical protein
MMLDSPGLKVDNITRTEDGYFEADIEVSPEFQESFMKKMNWKHWDDYAFSELLNVAILKYVNNKRSERGENPIES